MIDPDAGVILFSAMVAAFIGGALACLAYKLVCAVRATQDAHPGR
jgi:hypothetical protein